MDYLGFSTEVIGLLSTLRAGAMTLAQFSFAFVASHLGPIVTTLSGIAVEGLALMGYDAEDNVYRQWYFDSTGALPRGQGAGKWNAATRTFTWKGGPVNGITSTQTHRFIDRDTLVWKMVSRDRSGKVRLDMEAKARRK